MYKWNEIWQFCKTVEGFYGEEQAKFVWEHATKVQDKPGTMLEIGTFRGRAASILAFVGPIVCIDPFPLNDVYEYFQRIVEKHPMKHNFHIIKKWDYEVVDNWTEPVKLLHLDTEMQYEITYGVLNRWMPILRPMRTKLLIHHYDENLEVRNACNDLPISFIDIDHWIGIGYFGKLLI